MPLFKSDTQILELLRAGISAMDAAHVNGEDDRIFYYWKLAGKRGLLPKRKEQSNEGAPKPVRTSSCRPMVPARQLRARPETIKRNGEIIAAWQDNSVLDRMALAKRLNTSPQVVDTVILRHRREIGQSLG